MESPSSSLPTFQVVLNELRNIYQAPASERSPRVRLTESEVQRRSILLSESRSVLCDKIALYLARGFHNSELAFEFCDAILNDIHGAISLEDNERSELFWEVYLAFDEGEYYHGGNRSENPIETYTKPWVARIVEKYI